LANGCAYATAATGVLTSHDGAIAAYSTVLLTAASARAETGTSTGGAQQQSLRQVQVVPDPCEGESLWPACCAVPLCAVIPPSIPGIAGMPTICDALPPCMAHGCSIMGSVSAIPSQMPHMAVTTRIQSARRIPKLTEELFRKTSSPARAWRAGGVGGKNADKMVRQSLTG